MYLYKSETNQYRSETNQYFTETNLYKIKEEPQSTSTEYEKGAEGSKQDDIDLFSVYLKGSE